MGLIDRLLEFCNKNETKLSNKVLSIPIPPSENVSDVHDYLLWNGDCLEMLKKMKDKSVHLFLIDPPYGAVNNKYGAKEKFIHESDSDDSDDTPSEIQRYEECYNCNVTEEEMKKGEYNKRVMGTKYKMIKIFEQVERVLAENGHVVCFYDGNSIFEIPCLIKTAFRKKHPVSSARYIWRHFQRGAPSEISGGVATNQHKHFPSKQFEDIIVLWRTTKDNESVKESGTLHYDHVASPYSGQTNVLEYYKEQDKLSVYKTVQAYLKGTRRESFHLKPEDLLTFFITHYTREGQVVMDFYMNHAGTGGAALQSRRKFVGCEIEKEKYERAKAYIEERFPLGICDLSTLMNEEPTEVEMLDPKSEENRASKRKRNDSIEEDPIEEDSSEEDSSEEDDRVWKSIEESNFEELKNLFSESTDERKKNFAVLIISALDTYYTNNLEQKEYMKTHHNFYEAMICLNIHKYVPVEVREKIYKEHLGKLISIFKKSVVKIYDYLKQNDDSSARSYFVRCVNQLNIIYAFIGKERKLHMEKNDEKYNKRFLNTLFRPKFYEILETFYGEKYKERMNYTQIYYWLMKGTVDELTKLKQDHSSKLMKRYNEYGVKPREHNQTLWKDLKKLFS